MCWLGLAKVVVVVLVLPVTKEDAAAGCTVMMEVVCVVVVDMVATVRIVGDSVGQTPIGLFLMMDALMDSSFLSLSLVELYSLVHSRLVDLES